MRLFKDPKRWLIHLPIGAFAAWAGTQHWVYVFTLTVCFLAYEITQDWRIKDKAFIDIEGFLWGFGSAILILALT